jgi:PAS domain S-box-containing protein
MPNPKILIVEDDKTSALMLRQMLEKYGYIILASVATGEEAIVQSEKLQPDIILMDINLAGDKDGIETADIIYKKQGIPFLYLTVSTDDKTISRAKATTPYGYILKPYDKNMLYASIEMAIYKYETEQRLKESEKRNRDILSTIPDIMFNLNADGSFCDDIEREMARRVWNDKTARMAAPLIEAALKTGEPQIFEYSLKKADSISHLEARIIKSGGSKALVIAREVTDKKNAELELSSYRDRLEELVDQRTKELSNANKTLSSEIDIRKKIEHNLRVFSHAIDQNPNIVVIINKNSEVEYVNTKFTDLSGFSSDDIIGSKVNSQGNKVFPEPEMWDNIVKNSGWKGELYSLNKKGEIYYLNASVASIKDQKGDISHYIISAEDITQKKKDNMTIEQISRVIERSKVDLLDKDIDWQEWKEKMMSRSISRTDKSLFRNINNSFTQGAGFGTLISLLEMMSSTAIRSGSECTVDNSLFELISNNLKIAQDAFKTFSNIDWIISNEFALEKISLPDIYDYTKAVIEKAKPFTSNKGQRLIISDYKISDKELYLNLNKEHYFKAVYEGLINAMKFSKNNSYIVVIIHLTGRNLGVSIINDPEKTDEGIIGVPPEYEKVVFEPFYRLTKFVFEQYNTLDFGLGLTLIDKIIGKHGGEVFINNILDHTDLKREPQTKVNLTMMLPMLNVK